MDRLSPSALNQLRIRHLRLIEALVDVGSLHKASRALHVSQPAASAMLQEAERALGVVLFDRSRRGVVLNERGIIAVSRLKTVLGELGMLAKDLRSAEPTPVLRIGTLPHAFFGVLQRFLSSFRSAAKCRIDLIDGSAADLLTRLQQNELDCFIGRMPAARIDDFRHRGYFYQPLYDLEIAVLGARSHPLAGKRRVTLQDLSKCGWILPREGSNSRYVLAAAFAGAGVEPPRIEIETSSFAFTLPLLPGSDYLTVAPRDACMNQQRLGVGRILAIRLPQLLTPVAFVAQRSSMLNPNLQLLWQAIRAAMPYSGKNEPAAGEPVVEKLPLAIEQSPDQRNSTRHENRRKNQS
jgi:DNA-binding transcriptional LysR family regulator